MSDFLDVLSSLIAIKSVSSDKKACQQCLDFAVGLFRGQSLTIKFKTQDETPSVLITNTPDTHLDVLFLCHLDVVTADNEQFTLRQEGDKLFGRGVHDMKGPALSALWALKVFFAQPDHSLKVGALLVTDEETGGQAGSALWAQELFPRIVIEPDSGQGMNQIIERAKQPVFVRLTATGKSAHGSRPWLGVDAIQELLNVLALLQGKGGFQYYHQGMTPQNNGWVNTMHIGQIAGGQAMNAIAGQACATLDFRLTETMTDTKLLNLIDMICPPTVQWEVISKGVPVYTDLSHPAAQLYRQIVQDITHQELEKTRAFGATDGRYFAHKSLLLTHQENGGNAHGPQEYSSLYSLQQLIEIYTLFLQKYQDVCHQR